MKVNIQTVTTTEYVLTLTEAELTAALVDPAGLQAALRQARGQANPKPAGYGRNYGQRLTKTAAKKDKAGPKAPAPAGSAGTNAFTKEPCAKCGKLISRSQMHNHTRSCRGTAAAGSA